MQDHDTPTGDILDEGQAALRSGNHSHAEQCFRKALASDAGNVHACAGLGLALLLLQSFTEAAVYLERAAAAMPTDPQILEALGVAYVHTGQADEAEKVLRRALRFGRSNPETLANLAAALNENGRFDEAETMLRNCLRRAPDHLQAQHNLALLRLLNGDFENGWPGFELRNIAAKRSAPPWVESVGAPAWCGEDLTGRSILLYAEQGLGDTIQFARYASILAASGAEVVIQCQAALTELLGRIDGVSRTVSTADAPGRVDFKASLLSLPGLLGTSADTVPGKTPYISVSSEDIECWSEIVARFGDKPKVGLVWAGNPANKTDFKRSIGLERFAPLLGRDDCTVISLQVGAAARQTDELPPDLRPHELFPEIRPFGDVAAALRNLDLLITVDTALAHLAGALDVPVWTLITHFPDWRWMLGRDGTPWYPSMRLFRQPAPDNWDAVIEEVKKALDARIAD